MRVQMEECKYGTVQVDYYTGKWYILQLQDLRVNQVKKPYIVLTQENLIDNSIWDCLPYISRLIVYATLQLAYLKWSYIYLKVNLNMI